MDREGRVSLVWNLSKQPSISFLLVTRLNMYIDPVTQTKKMKIVLIIMGKSLIEPSAFHGLTERSSNRIVELTLCICI